jgi:hypothetical protein
MVITQLLSQKKNMLSYHIWNKYAIKYDKIQANLFRKK